jgi:hypothetical protein
MEVKCLSETSVDFKKTTLCYVPENKIHQDTASFVSCSSEDENRKIPNHSEFNKFRPSTNPKYYF